MKCHIQTDGPGWAATPLFGGYVGLGLSRCLLVVETCHWLLFKHFGPFPLDPQEDLLLFQCSESRQYFEKRTKAQYENLLQDIAFLCSFRCKCVQPCRPLKATSPRRLDSIACCVFCSPFYTQRYLAVHHWQVHQFLYKGMSELIQSRLLIWLGLMNVNFLQRIYCNCIFCTVSKSKKGCYM